MTSREDIRDTWGSERWVIEQLVAAVEQGDAEMKRQCAKRWLDGFVNHDWRSVRLVECGLFHPIREQHPRDYDPDDVADLLEGCADREVTESRIEKIRAGAPLRTEERRLWRQELVRLAFDDEWAYYGNCREWVILKLSAGARRVAHLGAIDWTDEEAGSYVAAYQTSGEVLNAIKRVGYVSYRDYIERASERRR